MTHDNRKRLERVVISPDLPISEALPRLDRAGTGILLLCDSRRRLVGLLTDGDIRRAMLHRVPFTRPCREIASDDPLVALDPVSPSEALHLMDHGKAFVVDHLPVVDGDRRLVDLLLRQDFILEEQAGVSAVIMAGGHGRRLRPLTEELPKPMLPLGDRPLMERTIRSLKGAGIHRVNVTTHYLPEKITEHFGDGSAFGVAIDYVTEERPLGTAGALSLLESSHEPLLVINGDILTQVDFRALLAFHRSHQAALTIAVRRYELQVPYGVVDSDGPRVKGVQEKPTYEYLVNAGIYLLEPEVRNHIPRGERFDMTDLIRHLVTAGRTVVSFPVVEYWLDIGRHQDYTQALADIEDGRVDP